MCDYVVQLSDVKAFCYTIQEALQLKKPVLTTPIKVLPEVGVKDGENGYILPFDLDEMTDEDVERIKNIPKVSEFDDQTEKIVKKWRKLLGNCKPTHSYKYDDSKKMIICNASAFYDVCLNRKFRKGETQVADAQRAAALVGQGYWSYLE